MMKAALGAVCITGKLVLTSGALIAQAVTGSISPDSLRLTTGDAASVTGVCSMGTVRFSVPSNNSGIIDVRDDGSVRSIKAGHADVLLFCGAPGHLQLVASMRGGVTVTDPPSGNITPTLPQLQVGEKGKVIGACTQGTPGYESGIPQVVAAGSRAPRFLPGSSILRVSSDGTVEALNAGKGEIALLCGDPSHRVRVAYATITVLGNSSR